MRFIETLNNLLISRNKRDFVKFRRCEQFYVTRVITRKFLRGILSSVV